MAKVKKALCIFICIYTLLFVSGIYSRLGIDFGSYPYRSLFVALLCAVTFLYFPLRKSGRNGISWYDFVFLMLGVVPCIYYFIFYKAGIQPAYLQHEASPMLIAMFLSLVVALFEGTRRVMGWAMPAVALLFFLYVMFGQYFPGVFRIKEVSLEGMTLMLYASDESIFGSITGIAATIIIVFVIFSQLVVAGGAGRFFLNVALGLFGHLRGGPAKASILGSALFGTLSGSPTANVAGTGSITIPLMKSIGYSPTFAGAVEAVASNGGQIMPPVMGAVAFIMADFIGVPYWSICVAGALPAILYYFGLFTAVDCEAGRLNLSGLPREQLPRVKAAFKEGGIYLLPIVGFMVLLGGLKYSPERAALVMILLLIAVSMFTKTERLGIRRIADALEASAKMMAQVGMACVMAQLIVIAVTYTALGIKLSYILLSIAGGNLLVLLLLAGIATFVLGLGLTTTPCYIMISALMVPAFIKMGVAPMAAHFFVLYWSVTEMITPPVCVAAFVAAGIAGAGPNRTGFMAMRLAVITYLLPFFFVYGPSLLLQGKPTEIAITVVTSLVGVFALAVGSIGYLSRSLGWLQRAAMLLAGALLVFASWQTDLIGVLLVIAVVLWQFRGGFPFSKEPPPDGRKRTS